MYLIIRIIGISTQNSGSEKDMRWLICVNSFPEVIHYHH